MDITRHTPPATPAIRIGIRTVMVTLTAIPTFTHISVTGVDTGAATVMDLEAIILIATATTEIAATAIAAMQVADMGTSDADTPDADTSAACVVMPAEFARPVDSAEHAVVMQAMQVDLAVAMPAALVVAVVAVAGANLLCSISPRRAPTQGARFVFLGKT